MRAFSAIDHVKKIWILQKVLQSKSLREAATRAKVTPQAVSQSLAALEKAVGKPLLIRNPSGIVATESALDILRDIEPALLMLEAMSSGSARGDGPIPSIAWMSFGTYESLAIDLLPRLTSELERKLPAARITLRIARSNALATAVRKGELCAALVAETDSFGRLDAAPIFEDRLSFYAAADSPSAHEGLRQSTKHRVGALAPGPDGYPRYCKRLMDRVLGYSAKPTVLSDSFEALRSAAVSGSLVALLPERVARRTPGQLVEVDHPAIDDPRIGIHTIYLISRPNCDPAEIAFLTATLKSLMSSLPTIQ